MLDIAPQPSGVLFSLHMGWQRFIHAHDAKHPEVLHMFANYYSDRASHWNAVHLFLHISIFKSFKCPTTMINNLKIYKASMCQVLQSPGGKGTAKMTYVEIIKVHRYWELYILHLDIIHGWISIWILSIAIWRILHIINSMWAYFFPPNNFWGQHQLICEMRPLTGDVVSWSVFPTVWLAPMESYRGKEEDVFLFSEGCSHLFVCLFVQGGKYTSNFYKAKAILWFFYEKWKLLPFPWD